MLILSIALSDLVTILGSTIEAGSVVFDPFDLILLGFFHQDLRAVVANTTKDFSDKLNQAAVVHRSSQLNVTKMSWTFFLG